MSANYWFIETRGGGVWKQNGTNWGQIFCFADDYVDAKHRLYRLGMESHGDLK